jgi:hypothetical protein
MNALKSMMEATASVRRNGAEAEIPAEQPWSAMWC